VLGRSAWLAPNLKDAQQRLADCRECRPKISTYALDYPTDYPTAVKATSGGAKGKSSRAGDPDIDDDDGESVGSRDSTDESDGAGAGSFIENDEGDFAYDEQAFRTEDEVATTSYDMDLEAEIFGDSDDSV
jgi:hypothetical protein